MDVEDIAAEAFAVLGTGRQIAPFSKACPDLGLADAYRVTAAVRARREARGERPIGRKIGFTNRTIWAEYGVYAPIWGYVYDSTVRDLAQRGARGFPRRSRRTPDRTGDRVRPRRPALARHGRAGADRLHRLDRAWLRDRAVDLPELVVPRPRHRCGLRPAWAALDRAAPGRGVAARGLGARAVALRDRSLPQRRHWPIAAERPMSSAGRCSRCVISPRRWRRMLKPAARARRDRDHRNAHPRLSDRRRRGMDHDNSGASRSKALASGSSDRLNERHAPAAAAASWFGTAPPAPP